MIAGVCENRPFDFLSPAEKGSVGRVSDPACPRGLGVHGYREKASS